MKNLYPFKFNTQKMIVPNWNLCSLLPRSSPTTLLNARGRTSSKSIAKTTRKKPNPSQIPALRRKMTSWELSTKYLTWIALVTPAISKLKRITNSLQRTTSRKSHPWKHSPYLFQPILTPVYQGERKTQAMIFRSLSWKRQNQIEENLMYLKPLWAPKHQKNLGWLWAKMTFLT